MGTFKWMEWLFCLRNEKNSKMSLELSKFDAIMVALAFHRSFARTFHEK